jgi:RNA-directed DNA polymerase
MSSLPFKNQFKHLAYILKINPKDLTEVLDNVDSFYYEYYEEKKEKLTGVVKTYKNGTPKKRTISPSLKKLKALQDSIKKNILDKLIIPNHIQGGVKGKSNITNAKCHQGKKFKFATDLMDFYPSVTNGIVHKTFLQLGYLKHQAHWLTRLTTFKYGLPQGTSTSPALANVCFGEVDNLLLEVCKQNEITYTRYVDDLTFSSSRDFRGLIDSLLKIITEKGYKISYRKTNYKADQSITGIDVHNNYIDVPNRIKEKVRTADENNGYTVYANSVRKTNKNMKNSTRHK